MTSTVSLPAMPMPMPSPTGLEPLTAPSLLPGDSAPPPSFMAVLAALSPSPSNDRPAVRLPDVPENAVGERRDPIGSANDRVLSPPASAVPPPIEDAFGGHEAVPATAHRPQADDRIPTALNEFASLSVPFAPERGALPAQAAIRPETVMSDTGRAAQPDAVCAEPSAAVSTASTRTVRTECGADVRVAVRAAVFNEHGLFRGIVSGDASATVAGAGPAFRRDIDSHSVTGPAPAPTVATLPPGDRLPVAQYGAGKQSIGSPPVAAAQPPCRPEHPAIIAKPAIVGGRAAPVGGQAKPVGDNRPITTDEPDRAATMRRQHVREGAVATLAVALEPGGQGIGVLVSTDGIAAGERLRLRDRIVGLLARYGWVARHVRLTGTPPPSPEID